MRKRERDQVAAVARQRLERLSAELAGLRPPLDLPRLTGADRGGVEPWPDDDAFDPVRSPSAVGPPPPGFGGVAGPVTRYATDRADGGPRSGGRTEDRGDAAGAAATVPGGSAVAAPPRPAGWRAIGPRAEEVEPDRTPAALVGAPGRHLQRRGDRPVVGWLDDRLPDALRGRVVLRAQHGPVVLALVGVALAVAGWLTLRSTAQVETIPSAKLVGSTGLPSLASSALPTGDPAVSVTTEAGLPGGQPSATATGAVVVDVAGKVRNPGIVTLPVGSRVQDAIEKAGGARPGVPLTAINLARLLVDGEQILVGRPVPAGTAPSAVGSTPSVGGLVNINSAGLSELDTLPGVGPVTAQKILDWRTANGPFNSVDELLEVDGIGDKTLADMAPYVTL